MTNGYIDIKNTDVMLIMGDNPAENHPCGFKWAIEAKKKVRTAKMIVVDPRFTRTAATADLFLQIRAGADIAFLGGMIRYAIENNRLAKDYLVNYTNAAFIVKDGFKLPELDGLFSGCNSATKVYDKSTWIYEAGGNVGPAAGAAGAAGVGAAAGAAGNGAAATAGAAAGGGASAAGADAGARHAAERRLRPLLAASALRLPTAQAAVLALHAGDGREGDRHPQGRFPEGRQHVHRSPQGRRHEACRHDHLRGRLNPAPLRQ